MNSLQPLVSIVIITFNRKTDLLRCLTSLQKLTYRHTETIVVDNHSSDGTVEAVKRQYPQATWILNPGNLGTARARNRGIARAQGELIWFLDSDTELLEPDILSRMVAYLMDRKDIGSLGGQMVNEPDGLKYWIMDAKVDRKIPAPVPDVLEQDVSYLATCNCLTRKSLLTAIGGFDPFYFYYCEDQDYGFQLSARGLKNVFRSDCCVLHHFSQNQRAGDYYLCYRNLMRCLLINQSFSVFFSFPITQAVNLYRNYRVFHQQGYDAANIKTVKDAEKEKYSGRLGVLRLIRTIIGALIRAWFYNLFHISDVWRCRTRRPNYLRNETDRS